MEYAIGIVVGILLAVLAGIIAAYFFFRDKSPVEIPPSSPPPSGAAAITALITESFLNDQLRQILVSDEPTGTASRTPVPQSFGPLKIKLNGASIKLLPDRRARLTIRLTGSAIGINLNLRPVTEFAFLLEPGRVRILITRILLQGITIPRQWVDSFISSYVASAEEQLNSYLNVTQDAMRVNLTELETADELLIVKFS